MENCPDCGAHLSGGWTQRTRGSVPGLPTACTPPAVLDGGPAASRRQPALRSVQWYLDTVHQVHQTAQRAQPAVAAILDRIRASPVVHADETGWREDGANGYLSAPPPNATSCGGVGARRWWTKRWGFSGVLVSDFYAAYHHYDGPKQRCWAHLLRDIHDQRTRYPKDAALAQWAAAVHQLYVAAKACNHHEPWQRRVAQLAGSGSCWPSAALSCLTRRVQGKLRAPRNSSSSWPNRTCQRTTTRRAQPAPSGYQSDQRRHSLGAGHREQDDAGIPLHLARPRSPLRRCSFPLDSELLLRGVLARGLRKMVLAAARRLRAPGGWACGRSGSGLGSRCQVGGLRWRRLSINA